MREMRIACTGVVLDEGKLLCVAFPLADYCWYKFWSVHLMSPCNICRALTVWLVSAIMQGWPAKAIKHCCDTGSAVVVMVNKLSRHLLHILDHVNGPLSVWVPYCAGILKCGSERGFKCPLIPLGHPDPQSFVRNPSTLLALEKMLTCSSQFSSSDGKQWS